MIGSSSAGGVVSFLTFIETGAVVAFLVAAGAFTAADSAAEVAAIDDEPPPCCTSTLNLNNQSGEHQVYMCYQFNAWQINNVFILFQDEIGHERRVFGEEGFCVCVTYVIMVQ